MSNALPREIESCLYRPLWNRLDPLGKFPDRFDWDVIEVKRAKAIESLHTKHWDNCRSLCAKVCSNLIGHETAFEVGGAGELNFSSEQADEIPYLDRLIARLIPWRNGPFKFSTFDIDAEWRTNLKWDRIKPHLPDLKDKRIAEVGCNNGYTMARLLEFDPRLVVGLDPSERCFFQFELMQAYLREPRLHYELASSSLLKAFRYFFDFILCQGVIYHRKDPLGFLKELHSGLKRNGQLLIESMCIAEASSNALCVSGRYAKMHNVYFIPTPKVLATWLESAGFEVLKVFGLEKTTPHEQRQTDYAPYQSLEDFLMAEDDSRTVEGYPAPYRVSVLARKY